MIIAGENDPESLWLVVSFSDLIGIEFQSPIAAIIARRVGWSIFPLSAVGAFRSGPALGCSRFAMAEPILNHSIEGGL